MSKAVIEVAGYELDLKGKLGFGLNYAIDDVNKPEKRNTNYSKTITLAGTKTVNQAMGGLFDVNSTFTFFNPNIKTPAKIIVNSSTVIEGFLQLKAIEKSTTTAQDGSDIEYKCVILSKATEFFADIKDKVLESLDFSTFNHTYNHANIVASWSHTPTDVYTYPMLYKYSNEYQTNDFKPAIYHKAYLKRIAQEAGYVISGTILDESTEEGAAYAKEIIPFNGELPVLPQAEYDRRLFKAGMTASSLTISSGTMLSGAENGNYNGNQTSPSQLTGFTNETTNGNFDPNGHWNTSLDEYTLDVNGNFNLNFDIAVKSTHTTKKTITSITDGGGSSILIDSSVPHGLPTGRPITITIAGTTNYDGTYTNITVIDNDTIKVNSLAWVANESTGTYGIDAHQSTYNWWWFQQQAAGRVYNQQHTYSIAFRIKRNGVTLGQTATATMVTPYDVGGADGGTFLAVNDWTRTYQATASINIPNITLLQNDVITIEKEVIDNPSATNGIPMYDTEGSGSQVLGLGVDYTLEYEQQSAGGVFTSISNAANNSLITDGDDISINDYIPKGVKQIDLLTDIIKRYNAYISVDEDNDRKIIIDTRDSYYAKGGELDWTNKRDYDSKEKITLLSELQNKEMLFAYKKDDDIYNENYSLSVDGDIYGQQTVEFDNQFVKGTKKVETPFSPTPLIYNSATPVAIVPAINTAAPQNNIRVLYFDGVIDCINSGTWNFNWINAGTPTTTTYSTYPYAGHYDHPITPTIDINFGAIPFAWYSEATNSTNGDLYNRFWYNYINQIDNGKLVTLKMDLNEVDINFIKNNLNTKIFIKDAWFYINKIKDYNPIQKRLTTVEFLKINDGQSFVQDTPTFEPPTLEFVQNIKSTGGRAGDTNTSLSENTQITGENNHIGSGSEGSIIIGDNNYIGKNSPNTIIQGNNIVVNDGLPNSFAIGTNDKTISLANEGYISSSRLINGVNASIAEPIDLADLLTLRDNSELVTGSTYYAKDEGLYLTAADVNVIASVGQRKMRVLKPSMYSTYQIHDAVTSFDTNAKVYWGGRLWNKTTPLGTSTAVDFKTLPPSDWEELTDDAYYSEKIFNIKYSEELDTVTEQSDDRGNIVKYTPTDAYSGYTLGDGFIYSDWSDERIFANTCSIFVNNDCPEITGNNVLGIIDNVLSGNIYNNTIKGDIRENTDSAGRTMNIFDNCNNGSIIKNNGGGNIDIHNNVNNGNIGTSASVTNRVTSITDTIVNK